MIDEPAISSSIVPIAEISGLAVDIPTSRGTVQAVRGVDLTIHTGEIIAVVGESGSGKSVMSACLLGLPPAVAGVKVGGSITVAGTDMLNGPDAERRSTRKHLLGAVFQDPLGSLNPTMKVRTQIAERGADADRSVEVLRDAGVPDAGTRLGQYPHELSGGLRQRVMLAIALAADGRRPDTELGVDVVIGHRRAPALIVADEPTTALDVSVQAQIVTLFDRLRREHGCAIVLVTHDLGVAASVADRIVVMYAGRICEDGPTSQVLDDPAHPYTRALIDSRIDLTGDPHGAVPIPGSPPDPTDPPPGCAFAPRCSRAIAACTAEPPSPATHRSSSRRVACFQPLTTNPAVEVSVAPQVILAPVAVAARPRSQSQSPFITDRPALSLEKISKSFAVNGKQLQAVRDVSLTVPASGAVALVGESGCGKTTLLRMATGLLTPDRGLVEWADPTRPPQLVFQDAGASLTPWLSVGRQVADNLRRRGLQRNQISDRTAEILESVGLDPRVARSRPRQLSGGQRQRAAIARALASDPTLLVCDEPVSALDASLAVRVLALLEELRETIGVAILMVTHDLAVARRIAERTNVMYLGQIVEQAPTELLFDHPLHPYTQGLIAASPTIEPGRLAPTLQGEPPSPIGERRGCAFAGRCPAEIPKCNEVAPLLIDRGGVAVACHVANRDR